MTDCKPFLTSFNVSEKFVPTKDQETDRYPYRELTDALMYSSVGSRPDIAHAMSWFSQFNSCHGKYH